MDNSNIRSVLQKLGQQVPPSSQLVLVGGGALALLGNPRLTVDIDFIGDDIQPSDLHRLIIGIAKKMKIYIEPVPLERFIPLPKGHENRNIYIGQFGNLEVYVADPYSMALSKLDRGLDTDFEDIVFLIQHHFVTADELENITKDAILQARKFDLHPNILSHLQELKNRLK